MKKTGIWLDKRQAKIVCLQADGTEDLQTLVSEVEEFNPIGGSGSRTKGGPQDVVQDSKFTEREKHQLQRFFKQLAQKVQATDRLVLFGPGQTAKQLAQTLRDDFPGLAEGLQAVEKADSMTDNQVKAWVRDYFDIPKKQ